MASNKDLILNYLATDRKWPSGVQLYFEIGQLASYKRQINTTRPSKSNIRFLHLTLGKESGVSENKVHHILNLPLNHPDLEKYRLVAVQDNSIIEPGNENPPKTEEMVIIQLKERKQLSLREEFPFLSDENCPDEMKVLISDLITDYHKAVSSHSALLNTPEEELYKIANETVVNYTNNKKAWEELENYKQNGTVLGVHPIFKHKKLIETIKGLSLEQLVVKKQQIEKRNVQRKSEMEFGDKPHLVEKRALANERDEDLLEVIEEILNSNNE